MKTYAIYHYDHNGLRKLLGKINTSSSMLIEDIISYLINEQFYPGNIFLLEE